MNQNVVTFARKTNYGVLRTTGVTTTTTVAATHPRTTAVARRRTEHLGGVTFPKILHSRSTQKIGLFQLVRTKDRLF